MENEKPIAKFYDGQIVECSDRHFSKAKYWTRLLLPRFVEKRGWVYAENYIDEDGEGGGTGFYFEESLFQEITDPIKRLKARALELKIKRIGLQAQLQEVESEQNSIQKAFELMGIEHLKEQSE